MTQSHSIKAQRLRLMHRVHARLSTMAKPATGFVSMPEPRTIGTVARGRQLMAGNFLFAGHLVEAPKTPIWDLIAPDAVFERELQGFAWLDDMAAVGDPNARRTAQAWTWQWIERFGRGRGPGWVPDLAGRRLIRWINHALFLLSGMGSEQSAAFFQSLGQQTIFLGRAWRSAGEGLPRIEALTGLIYAGLALTGMEKQVAPAVRGLARECETCIDEFGGIPCRNPEDLLTAFTLLIWAAGALRDAGHEVSEAHQRAIERIAPTLRVLRHADGALARFHGGGRGPEGRLDHALAESGVKTRLREGLSMGYARLSAGRTSIVVDAAAPPKGTASWNAHASVLAFELTSGRRPLIVNCGSGAVFGAEWHRAGRATPSHSTLVLDGMSSSRLADAPERADWRHHPLVEIPGDTPVALSQAPDGVRFEGAHNGYVPSHGITHARQLELTFDGRGLVGEDLLLAIDPEDRTRFDAMMDEKSLQGIPFQIRFHLHPEVDASVDLGGSVVSLALKSGEIWVFRHDGIADMSVEASVYLEKGRLKPRAAKQIVLSGAAIEYATRIRWSLAKAQDGARAIRDIHRDEQDMTL